MAKTFIVGGLDEVAFAFSAPANPSRSAADARRGSSPKAAAGHLSLIKGEADEPRQA